jgi:hypothetical protein
MRTYMKVMCKIIRYFRALQLMYCINRDGTITVLTDNKYYRLILVNAIVMLPPCPSPNCCQVAACITNLSCSLVIRHEYSPT